MKRRRGEGWKGGLWRERGGGGGDAVPPVREFHIGVSKVYALQRPPKPFADRGLFWFFAWASHYTFQPSARLSAILTQARNSMGFRHPIIGVHARQGDACRSGTGRKCFTPTDYLRAVRNMTRRYRGVNTVFVATDCPHLVAALRNLDGVWVCVCVGVSGGCVGVCVGVCVCIYVCMHVFMYVYTHTFSHTHTQER